MENKNTIVRYLYRDASNYKNHKSVVIKGKATKEQDELIQSCLDENTWFIPQQVGLPDAHFTEYAVNEDDHAYCEDIAFEATSAEPTLDLTVEQLVANFINAKGRWDESLWVH